MKNSDIIKMKTLFGKAGKRFLLTTCLLLAIFVAAFATEPITFMEGSTHSFSVKPSSELSTLTWSVYENPYKNIAMDAAAYFIENPTSDSVSVTFTDMGRAGSDTVYLVVAEKATNGGVTKRAMQILLEPNNMYFDFAYNSETEDCYNFEANYAAAVEVGMDFNYRVDNSSYEPIPEERFPLQVKYTVFNVTIGDTVRYSTADYVKIEYSTDNSYSLEITEATGALTQTIEYELQITEVLDKYETAITHDKNRRLQIRIINHLPQTGGMETAMAYVITPINYGGSM